MQNVILEADEPPKSGEWVDNCDVIANPTELELETGQILGVNTDPEDDEDGGEATFAPAFAAAATDLSSALAKARLLKAVMLDHGVPEVSIELQAGRPNSHGVFDALFIVAEMSHHTVSRLGSNLTPVLALCKSGRSDVPGPLCNGYGGYDLCYRILTFGYANHPGEGGPITVDAKTAGSFTIPRDSARRYAWGTEWEGGLNVADWDKVLRNPRNGVRMTMREFMGRSNAALREYHQIVAHLEHSTWTTRKIDRLGYTAAKGEAELRRFMKEDDDMTPEQEARLLAGMRKTVQEEVAKVAPAVWATQVDNLVTGKKIGVGALLSFMHKRIHGHSTEDADPKA